MPQFTVSPVQSDQIFAAFPLVRMAMPELDPKSWSRFVAGLSGRGGAMLGVFAGDATLHGIAVYRIEESLKGHRLAVDALVTFELNRAAPARAVLIDALEQEAARNGCASLSLTLPARKLDRTSATRMRPWLDLGLNPDSIVLGKSIAGGPAKRLAAPG